MRARLTVGTVGCSDKFPSRSRFLAPFPLQMTSEQVEGINFLGMRRGFGFGVILLERELSCAIDYCPSDIGSTPLFAPSSYSRDADSRLDITDEHARCQRLPLTYLKQSMTPPGTVRAIHGAGTI